MRNSDKDAYRVSAMRALCHVCRERAKMMSEDVMKTISEHYLFILLDIYTQNIVEWQNLLTNSAHLHAIF